MPSDQIPNYFVVGAQNKAFEDEQPFTIDPKAKTTSAKTGSAARKSSKAERPIDFVLRELKAMGLTQGTAKTDLKKFFAQCEEADDQLGLDFTRTDAFRATLASRFPGRAPKKGDLLRGRHPTPQAIADLVT